MANVSLLPAALEYANQGWAILPLQSRGKRPRIDKADGGNGWKDATTNLDQIRAWWTQWPTANIGYAPRGRMLIIDIDPRNGGKDGWLKLTQAITMPDTRRAKTGSGYHVYFTLPDGFTFPSCDLPGYTGLEIKCESGYVLLPPSIHPDGPTYTWQNPETPIALAPDALIALLLPRKENKSQEWKQERPQGSVIDAYNARYSIYEQLERYGYVSASKDRYKRPGGRSASVVVLEGSRSYHHSNSDELHSEKTHDAFSIYCHFEHQGDVKSAVKAASELLGMRQKSEPKPRAGPDERPTPGSDDKILNTDAGNARRLVALFGRDIRYCPEWKSWLVWTGKYWQRDVGELLLMQMAKRTVQSLYREARAWVDKLSDERPPEMVGEEADKATAFAKKAAGLLKWAIASENSSRLRAMIGLAQDEPGIPVSPSAFDRHPYLYNAQNGTIDLRTGELREHSRENYLTILVDIDYDPQATCPRWQQFLGEVLATSDTVAFIKRAIGYTLTGETYEHAFFFMGGKGGNGKSTLQNTMLKVLGDYGHKAGIETFMESQHARSGSSASPDVAALPGKRLVSPGEVKQGHKLNEQFVKELVSADPQAARQLYERQFSFIPQCKVWMYGNYDPRITGRDEGIWRRFHYIPFKAKFTENPGDGEKQKDELLPKKLEQELPGILAWAVQGCMEWQQIGLGVSQEVKEATNQYNQRQDALAPFLEDRCIIAPQAKAKKSALWKAYQEWLEENAEASKFDTSHALSRELKTRGFKDDVKINGARFWNGIGLLDDTAPPPPPPEEQNGATSQEATNPDVDSPDGQNGATWGNLLQEVPNLYARMGDFPKEVAQVAPNEAPSQSGPGLTGFPKVAPTDNALLNVAPTANALLNQTNGTSALQPDETPSQGRLRIVREEDLKAARRRKQIEEARELLPRLTLVQRFSFRAYLNDWPAFWQIRHDAKHWANVLGWYEDQAKLDAKHQAFLEHLEQAFIQQFGDCFAEKEGPDGL